MDYKNKWNLVEIIRKQMFKNNKSDSAAS